MQQQEIQGDRAPASNGHMYYSDDAGFLTGTALKDQKYRAPKTNYKMQDLSMLNLRIRNEFKIKEFKTVLIGKFPYLNGITPRVGDCNVTIIDFLRSGNPVDQIVIKIETKTQHNNSYKEEYFATTEDLLEINKISYYPDPISIVSYRTDGEPDLVTDLFMLSAKNSKFVSILTNTRIRLHKQGLTCELQPDE